MQKISLSKKRLRAFTLIELLVSICLAAIILSIGVPSFAQLIASNKLHTTRDLLVSSLTHAQQHAMKKNIAVYLCPTLNTTSCASSWRASIGWLVYEDKDRNNAFTANSDEIISQHSSANVDAIMSDNVELRFSSTGHVGTNIFTLCNDLSTENDDRISINRSGRITYEASGSYCTP